MRPEEISALVLAGGFSRRMGCDKAALLLGGQTLLERQTEKLRRLGIRDIMLSGCREAPEDCRAVEDVFPHRGPLSGIHACLLAAEYPACLVLSVDVPLVPEDTLRKLVESHRRKVEPRITVLRHGERIEPLLAVYDNELRWAAERILRSEKTAVMRLLDAYTVHTVDYTGDEFQLTNCNTPEAYAKIAAYCEANREENLQARIKQHTDGCL